MSNSTTLFDNDQFDQWVSKRVGKEATYVISVLNSDHLRFVVFGDEYPLTDVDFNHRVGRAAWVEHAKDPAAQIREFLETNAQRGIDLNSNVLIVQFLNAGPEFTVWLQKQVDGHEIRGQEWLAHEDWYQELKLNGKHPSIQATPLAGTSNGTTGSTSWGYA